MRLRSMAWPLALLLVLVIIVHRDRVLAESPFNFFSNHELLIPQQSEEGTTTLEHRRMFFYRLHSPGSPERTTELRAREINLKADLSPEEELQLYIYSGNYRKVQEYLDRGVDPNHSYYPSCGPKGRSLLLSVNAGYALMTRLLIQHGARVDETLMAAYTSPDWGWIEATPLDLALEMGRPDLVQIIQKKKGLRGRIRNVGNLHEYFEFRSYDPNSSMRLVPGPPYLNEVRQSMTNDHFCRFKTSYGFQYASLTRNAETGAMICDSRLYKGNAHSPHNGPFEALYIVKPLKSNQEIVYEVSPLRSDRENFRYSYQPPDDPENAFAICYVSDGFTVTGRELMWTRGCGMPRSQYTKWEEYHSVLTLVEVDGGSPTTAMKEEQDQRLLVAAYTGDLLAAREALEAGGDVDSDRRGWTPLLYAAYFGHSGIAKLLLDHSADVSRSVDGYTAEDLAHSRGHTEILSMLQKVDRSLQPRARKRGLPSRVVEP